MHRTLKEEVAQPPAANRRKQQRALMGFARNIIRCVRTKRSEMRTPAAVYEALERNFLRSEPHRSIRRACWCAACGDVVISLEEERVFFE